MPDMFPKGATYYIKGGNEIAYSKIDSVIASWSGAFNIEHGDNNKIYLAKPTEADARAFEELRSKTNSVLNQPAKDFTLTDVNGKTYTLANLKGKTVVLNFWFTTCAGCIEEMPELNKIRKSYAGKNVVFLALALDDAQSIRNFTKKHSFEYSLLSDAANVAADYKVSMYPTSMVINRQGLISFVQVSGKEITETLPKAIDATL